MSGGGRSKCVGLVWIVGGSSRWFIVGGMSWWEVV